MLDTTRAVQSRVGLGQIWKYMALIQNSKRENKLVILAVTFSALTWIVLIPAFYFRNIWLLPLHEINLWVQQQVKTFVEYGFQVDTQIFRHYTFLMSKYASCVSLASSLIAVPAGFKAYRIFQKQDNALRVKMILIIAMILGLLGTYITL